MRWRAGNTYAPAKFKLKTMNQLLPIIRRVRRPLWSDVTQERPAAIPPAVERGEPTVTAPREPAAVAIGPKRRKDGPQP